MPLEIVAESTPEPEGQRITFNGAEFRLAGKVGLMPLMKFAVIAQRGVDSSDQEGLVAMYKLLQQCIADDEWVRFEEHAEATRADDDDLLQVVKDTMNVLSQRPTSRPSASSDGPQQTTPTSEEDSSSLEVVRRLKSQGRPDLAMAVLARQQTG
jgi:hypothetical protein